MVGTDNRGERSAIVVACIVAIAILGLKLSSDGLIEKGDGVMHYLIARYTWQHPVLFLDLWGKPLFNTLASPFAQFGHFGVALFNIVVAAVTGWVGVLALRKAGPTAQASFPLLVLLAPQYVLMTMAGMTEPLFGLVTVATTYFLVRERPVAAAITASLAPFARPEYIAFLPAVAFWLMLQKQWRALPWCLTGFVIYAVFASIVWEDPFWFWTSDPYDQAGGIYGSGPLDYFTHRAEQVFGRPLLTLAIAAFFLWPALWWFDRSERRMHLQFMITTALPAIGIVAVHSVLWYVGTRGSAGLIRVLVTAIPLAGIFAAMTLGRGALLLFTNVERKTIVALGFVGVLALWSVADLLKQQEFPIKADHEQRLLVQVADDLAGHYKPGVKVYTTHPYMAFGAGLDPFDTTITSPVRGFDDGVISMDYKVGDLLVWDAQLGSNESGVKLERVLNDGRFKVLNMYEPREGYRVLGGYVMEMFIFERRDVVRTFTMDTLVWNGAVRSNVQFRADLDPCGQDSSIISCIRAGEFPLEFNALPMPGPDDLYDEWTFSARVDQAEGSPLAVVLKQTLDGQDVRYDQEEVPNGEWSFTRKVPVAAPGTDLKIYFWNYDKDAFKLSDLKVLRKRWIQRPA
jgi:hypothetical protein